MWYFYVLQSIAKSDYFYKGSTGDLRRRLVEHNSGETTSIRPYLPFRLIYYEAYLTENAARKREKSIKDSGAVWAALMGRVKKSIEPLNANV